MCTGTLVRNEQTVRERVARIGRRTRRVCTGTLVHYEQTVRSRKQGPTRTSATSSSSQISGWPTSWASAGEGAGPVVVGEAAACRKMGGTRGGSGSGGSCECPPNATAPPGSGASRTVQPPGRVSARSTIARSTIATSSRAFRRAEISFFGLQFREMHRPSVPWRPRSAARRRYKERGLHRRSAFPAASARPTRRATDRHG